MMRPVCIALWVVGGLLCSSSCGRGAEDCRARQPSQAEGVYGCVTSANDIGKVEVRPLPGFSIQAFQSEPPPTPDDGLVPWMETKSDAAGFYALSLSAGSYWICTSFRRCVAVAVPAGENVALHYEFGLGPGWSPATPAPARGG